MERSPHVELVRVHGEGGSPLGTTRRRKPQGIIARLTPGGNSSLAPVARRGIARTNLHGDKRSFRTAAPAPHFAGFRRRENCRETEGRVGRTWAGGPQIRKPGESNVGARRAAEVRCKLGERMGCA